jgi:hypothetical protein
LAERAVFGLDPAEGKACAELASLFPEIDLECMDRLAAAVVLGSMGDRSESLPARLRPTIRATALEQMEQPHPRQQRAEATRHETGCSQQPVRKPTPLQNGEHRS